MDRGAWWATVHMVSKSQTGLSDFTFTFRLVITFPPRSKRLLISWLQSPFAVILEPPKIKSVTVSTVPPSICHEVKGLDAMILVFWTLSFKPTFFFSFAILWNSAFRWVYLSLFSLAFCFSFFPQLFVKPPQTTALSFYISFSLRWFWSLPPVVLQALCLYNGSLQNKGWMIFLLFNLLFFFFCKNENALCISLG